MTLCQAKCSCISSLLHFPIAIKDVGFTIEQWNEWLQFNIARPLCETEEIYKLEGNLSRRYYWIYWRIEDCKIVHLHHDLNIRFVIWNVVIIVKISVTHLMKWRIIIVVTFSLLIHCAQVICDKVLCSQLIHGVPLKINLQHFYFEGKYFPQSFIDFSFRKFPTF